MSNIDPAAAAARENHRTADGRFGEQHHPEPAPDVLDDQPVPISSLGLQPGDQLQVGEDEHADPDIATLTLSRDADGTLWAKGGPTVYFDAAAPDGTDAEDYLDRNSHRIQAFAADTYDAPVQLDDTAADRRILIRAPLEPDTEISQVCQTIHDRTRLDDLAAVLADSEENGRSAFSRPSLPTSWPATRPRATRARRLCAREPHTPSSRWSMPSRRHAVSSRSSSR